MSSATVTAGRRRHRSVEILAGVLVVLALLRDPIAALISSVRR